LKEVDICFGFAVTRPSTFGLLSHVQVYLVY